MSKTISETLASAGSSVATAENTAGSKIAQGADKAVDFVTGPQSVEGNFSAAGDIKLHMSVIASCGKEIGVVAAVQEDSIKLTRKDSPDDQHHYIPLGWVSHVDQHVHLNRNSKEAVAGWKRYPDSSGWAT